jgi:RNA polymerase sigma-70 factor (ECF subfamily)
VGDEGPLVDEQAERQEQQWVRRARAGDPEAFAALVERYWERVYHWLRRLTGCRHGAEDLTQEVFLRAWSGLPALQSPERFRPWVFRIARNCLIDSRRALRCPGAPLPEDVCSSEPEPVHAAVAEESLSLLEEACARLPLDYRAALLLWTQERMSYPEIAQALGITEALARWRVHKARQRLLRELGPYLDRSLS